MVDLGETTNDRFGKKELRMREVVDAEASTFGNNPRYWETYEEVDVGYYARRIVFRAALGAVIFYGVYYFVKDAW